MGSHRYIQVRRPWPLGRGVGADRLPQLLDQSRRNHDRVLTPGIASTATFARNEFMGADTQALSSAFGESGHELGTRGYTKLRERSIQVRADGAMRQIQTLPDLAIGQAFRRHFCDLHLLSR